MPKKSGLTVDDVDMLMCVLWNFVEFCGILESNNLQLDMFHICFKWKVIRTLGGSPFQSGSL